MGPNLPIDDVLLLFLNNTRPHTGIRTRETIASFGLTTLPHPTYSLNLAPSDYHLFGPMKEDFRGKYNASDGEVKKYSDEVAQEQSTEFYEAGIQSLIQTWNTAIERNSDYV